MRRGAGRRGATRIVLLSAAAAGFVTGAAGCSSDAEAETVYCVDADRRVVEDFYCDDDADRRGSKHGYFLWHKPGRHKYAAGAIVAGGSLIRTDDAAARSRLGLPAKGHVASGVISRGGIGDGDGRSSGG